MMAQKIFWLDTETTGLDPKKNSIIQLGGVIEINGEVAETVELLFRPIPGRQVDAEALKCNGRSIKEIMGFPEPIESVNRLKRLLERYVDKYDVKDKFVAAGFNVNFDVGFLREIFAVCGDRYYGSWFFNTPLDVWTIVSLYVLHYGLRLPNYKLATVCKCFGIRLKDAHDAINDVLATRSLYWEMIKKLAASSEIAACAATALACRPERPRTVVV